MMYVMGLFRLPSGEEEWKACFATENRGRAAAIARVLLKETVCFDAYVMSAEEMRRKLGAEVLVTSQVSADLYSETPEGRAVTELVESQVDLPLADRIYDTQRELRSCARELEALIQEAFGERWTNEELMKATNFTRLQLLEIRRHHYIPGL